MNLQELLLGGGIGVVGLSEEQALEVDTMYPAWEAARSYAVGDILQHGTNSVGGPAAVQGGAGPHIAGRLDSGYHGTPV